MLPEVAQDVPPQVRFFLLQRLKEYGVNIKTETTVAEFLEDGAVVTRNGETSKLEGFDSIVLAMGTKSVNYLHDQLTEKITELHVIGDALAPRQAIQAIEEGARVGIEI
jgi:NADH dehydrogenase FAD-containing subunit